MQFWELRASTSPETIEGVTNFLWELGALGVVEEELPGRRPALRAFFPESASSSTMARAVAEYGLALRALGFEMAVDPPEIHPVLEDAWASAWQTGFPPRAMGDRLLVVPPWHESDGSGDEGRRRVVIEPGRAFGTGHHGSTEGCLVLLERAVALRPGGRVLDIGAGSGILAIAAVALGALSALAIDVDPDAVRSSAENASRNGCADRVAVALGGPEIVPNGDTFDLVLANLLGPSHLALCAEYQRLLAPTGVLVLGGMLASDDESVRRGLAAAGFTSAGSVAVEGWSSVAFTRSPSP